MALSSYIPPTTRSGQNRRFAALHELAGCQEFLETTELLEMVIASQEPADIVRWRRVDKAARQLVDGSPSIRASLYVQFPAEEPADDVYNPILTKANANVHDPSSPYDDFPRTVNLDPLRDLLPNDDADDVRHYMLFSKNRYRRVEIRPRWVSANPFGSSPSSPPPSSLSSAVILAGKRGGPAKWMHLQRWVQKALQGHDEWTLDWKKTEVRIYD